MIFAKFPKPLGMKAAFFWLPVCCFAVALGCGDDDDTGGAPHGMAGASAGHAGKASGAGGGAGEGGAGGEAGKPALGSGGTTAGRGGSGNHAGTSAVAGEAGASGASANSAGGESAGGESAGGQGGSAELANFELEPASVSVAIGEQKFVCAVLDLGNAQPIHAGELHVTTSDAVYDLRVSAVSGTAAPAPVDCEAFGELNDTSVRPLLFTRQRSEDLVFPSGTAYTLSAHQLLRFELHALNQTQSAEAALSHLTVVPVPSSSYVREAGLLILSDLDVNIPPGMASVHTSYFDLPSAFGAASVFRAAGDTHALGTEIKLATASQSSGPFTDFYDATGTPPAPASIEPPATLPANGGIQLQCSWYNGTQAAVTDGNSFLDEQCTGYVYYAPAVDTGVCVRASGTVVCCSDAGGSCSVP